MQPLIRVASYNMRKAIGLDRRRDPARTLHVLCELDADVIALQEADKRFGVRASAMPPLMIEDRSDYHPVPLDMRPHSIGWHGNAILVRKGIEVRSCAPIELPTLEPRGAVMAEIAKDGVALRVIGMHLDLSGLVRRRQARAVLAALAAFGRMPTVMMGDLNEWSLRGGCLKEFGRDHRLVHTGRSFHTRRPMAALDRIFVSRDLAIVECGVHQSPIASRASDHLPIWAALRPVT
ncbi:MAG: endonuclease/exonuclease/phosphatase family protein [Sphingomonadaceae bacterium]|nr:endonuclease/exonuclease/phosphatase family protein [Sphingomonadaceae bacterium]